MNLILTLDYELFGDGSGDIFEHMIKPTNQILKICKIYGIKITIFFEIIEYMILKKEWDNGNKMGYKINPIKAIETQIAKAYSFGNDVQLHFHPQWINATYTGYKWNLNFENWRLGDFETVGSYDTLNLFKEGIKVLKETIQGTDPSYSPKIIRAGGYNIVPSKAIIDAMKTTGIKADSSVYPGGYENGTLSKYDYRKVPSNRDYWFVNDYDFCIPSPCKDGLLEVPIFSIPQTRWKKYGTERIKSILLNKKSAIKSLKDKTVKKNLFEKAFYFFQKESVIWDFCTLSPKMHNRFFDYIHSQLKGTREYFVLVGHSKNYTSGKAFRYLIDKAISKNFNFKTLNDYVKTILD